VFAGLIDPPTGVAVPNSHAPHGLDATGPVPPHTPVYHRVSFIIHERSGLG